MNRSSMKLIGNKNNPNCVELMEWSQNMDLLALATDTGMWDTKADKAALCTFTVNHS